MVYLIHFDKKFHHAQHYIGFVDHLNNHTLESRVDYHRRGQGSRLLRAVAKADIKFEVVRTWPDGDRNFERSLKNKKNAKTLCPICNPSKDEKGNKQQGCNKKIGTKESGGLDQ